MATTKLSKEYDKDAIFETLDDLKITQSGNNIITKFQNRMISNVGVSDKYQLFNFPGFAKKVISEIENYFTPETYSLKIYQGRQEIRLVGEEVLINGDIYKKMFNLLNSTDKSRALQLNIGLMRQICTNGMVVGVEDEYANTRVKHFKNSLPERVKLFVDGLSNFDLNLNGQVSVIEGLMGSKVSFQELAEKLVTDEEGIVNANKVLKLRAFANKLLKSETDALTGLSDVQTNLLKNPEMFNKDFVNVDIEMEAYKALNCYTEVFRNYDSSILKRETNRILELV